MASFTIDANRTSVFAVVLAAAFLCLGCDSTPPGNGAGDTGDTGSAGDPLGPPSGDDGDTAGPGDDADGDDAGDTGEPGDGASGADDVPNGDNTPGADDVPNGDNTPGGDDEPACTPQPFVPVGEPVDWRHFSTELLVLGGAANHRGQDVVAVEGNAPVLIGKFAYGVLDDDLEDEDIEVFLQLDPPCGDWTSFGTVRSSEDGEYGTLYGVEDDGGRVFFEFPAAEALLPGRYPVRMLVLGDHSLAAFTLDVIRSGTGIVVFDIDGTLTTDDAELVSELWYDLFGGTYVPEPYPGGEAVASVWDARGWLIVYLTGRPDFLRARSQQWLVERSFPAGVVHLTDTNAQALPTSGGVAQYKTDFLNGLSGAAEGELFAAYGNATTDIEAYANAGIVLERTFIIGPHAGEEGTVAIVSYPDHQSTAEAMPLPLEPGPPSSGWW